MKTIRRNCHLNAEPGYCISIDESMIAFKGRYAGKQYLPRKPIKWGFKCIILADSLSGYVYDFHLY